MTKEEIFKRDVNVLTLISYPFMIIFIYIPILTFCILLALLEYFGDKDEFHKLMDILKEYFGTPRRLFSTTWNGTKEWAKEHYEENYHHISKLHRYFLWCVTLLLFIGALFPFIWTIYEIYCN